MNGKTVEGFKILGGAFYSSCV